MRVSVFTSIPSPYQVEFLGAIARRVDLRVVFAGHIPPRRPWQEAAPDAPALFLSDGHKEAAQAREWLASSDVVVFNWYRDGWARAQMSTCERRGRAWAFWGERPGLRGPAWLGRLYRRVALSPLHSGRAPIWGIGSWAVDCYRSEFGEDRDYANIPYFSDLRRFEDADVRSRSPRVTRTFVFSGKLNARKGVDLLIAAAAALLPRYPAMRLLIAGDGPLRTSVDSLACRYGERVRALGFVSWADLPGAYAEGDVLVAPSRYDGWNLVVAEGLASGMPVIGSDRTGAGRELINPGGNGWLVEAGSLSALVSAMEAALRTPDLDAWSRAATASARVHRLDVGAERFVQAARAALRSEGAPERH